MTDELIDRLTADLTPARGNRVARRLTLGVGLGAAVALAGVLAVLGPRADMPQALGAPIFWVKLAYCAAFGLVGAICVERLARPGGEPGTRLAWLGAPLVLVAVASALQTANASPVRMHQLLMGGSSALCPWFIIAASTPVFVAMIWVMRGLAPTRLRLAGAVAGLTAGGFGAMAYSLHCGEVGAPFLAVWYSLGILTPAAVGALLGSRLLRW
jgi:hypothetical protein